MICLTNIAELLTHTVKLTKVKYINNPRLLSLVCIIILHHT